MRDYLLQQVRCLDPVSGQDAVLDVWVAAGRVEAMAPQIPLPPGVTVIPAAGRILGPGLVDLYSHSSEPGYESRETMASLLAAAQGGGFTRIHLLPDMDPPLDRPAGLADWLRRLGHEFPIQVGFWGALTQNLAGEQMAELADLYHAEVVGFSDGRPLTHLGLVRRLLEYAKPWGIPVALWPWEPRLAGVGVAREGAMALALGLPEVPASAETAALAALLEVIASVGTAVHLLRISTARSVELLRQARTSGVPVTASTPWFHLLLSTADLASLHPHLRVTPPLGTPEDREALIAGIAAGWVDAIAVDHTPYTYEEKTVPFGVAPSGMVGYDLVLPLLWERLVTPGLWDALTLWQALSTRPAACLGQTPPRLIPGSWAGWVLFDPDLPWDVTPKTLRSQATNTPWLHQSCRGRVVALSSTDGSYRTLEQPEA